MIAGGPSNRPAIFMPQYLAAGYKDAVSDICLVEDGVLRVCGRKMPMACMYVEMVGPCFLRQAACGLCVYCGIIGSCDGVRNVKTFVPDLSQRPYFIIFVNDGCAVPD